MFAHVIRTHVDGQKLGATHTYEPIHLRAHVATAVVVQLYSYMMKIPNRNENGKILIEYRISYS